MKHVDLIKNSRQWFEKEPEYLKYPVSLSLFAKGGEWMSKQLIELDGMKKTQIYSSRFSFYGLLKYILCILISGVSGCLLAKISLWLIPFAIIVFYMVEVHFLFLFPLVIDNAKKPVIQSIQQTYRLGFFKCLITVFCIGFFMLIGLFNTKSPFHNWHIGSIAILIWYKDEVRNWVR